MYRYNDRLYLEKDIDQAIVDVIGSDYNNIDPTDTGVFMQTFYYDCEPLDKNDWAVFKEYCKQEGLNPSHDKVVEEYMRKVS